jgi:hypothetical protein
VGDEPFRRGPDDEVSEVNQEWLKTPEGRDWLHTDEGISWFRSTEGKWWSRSEDAHAWYEELAQGGWSDYFAGKAWPMPQGWLTPENAPQIGSRVRLNMDGPTLGGTTFEVGEEALVTELRFSPVGAVSVTLRTPDGRSCMAMRAEDFDPIEGK